MVKVSVIVPNYNHAAYLDKRINSILSQTFKDYELILLDDNSSDNSRQILDAYRSLPNVKIIVNENNSGSSFKQWNKGAKLSSGKYIWIAESDDFADREFLSTLVPILDNNSDISLAYVQSYEINEGGDVIGNWIDQTKQFYGDKWVTDFIIQGNEMVKKYMIHHNVVPNASGVLFRKDKMESIGMADESFRLNGDWLFWIKLMENSAVAFVSKSLNYFRTHGNSVRSLTKSSALGLFEYTRIIEYVSEHLKFTWLERKGIVLDFYKRSKYSPLFYSWKMEPLAFKYVRKSYSILIRQNKIGILLFIKHIGRRFCLYYIKHKLFRGLAPK